MGILDDHSQLFIGGKWVDASGGTYDVVNPATEEIVGTAPNATPADAEAAAAAAREAGPGWAATPPEERSALMARAARAIEERAQELLPLVIAETGATAAVGSSLQVPIAVSRFDRYSLDLRPVAQRALPPQVAVATPLAPGGLISALALRPPVGVVACITSYNFPLVNMAGKVAPRAGHGQHRRREAGRPGPARRGGAGAHPGGGGLPARCRQPRQLGRCRCRPRRWSSPATWT